MGAPGKLTTDDLKKPSAGVDNTVSTYLSLIQQYLGVFMLDNATWLAERCVAEYPENFEAIYLLALCHYRAGYPKRARQVLERAPGVSGPHSSSMQYLSAQCSYDLKEYSRAEGALLKSCRASYKQNRSDPPTTSNMDDWVLNTTPCPVPNGAAGLALLGKICRKSNRQERASKYFQMSLKLDPFLWTSFEALAEMGVENIEASEVFGVPPKHTVEASFLANAKTPLQPMETPAAASQKQSVQSSVLRHRSVHFETPNLTPIPVNASLLPAETPKVAPQPENLNVLRRAREVAARHYYPPSPETPMTTVTRSMRYLRGLGSEVSSRAVANNDGGRSLFASENTASNQAIEASHSNDDPPEKPAAKDSKVHDILELLSTAGTAYQRVRQYRCKEALQALQTLPPRQQATGWALQQQGRAHLELNDFASAQRCLEYMQVQDPGRMQGLELLSTVYWQLKKEIELAHLAHRAVDWDRLAPETWCIVGNCFSLQKDHETALLFFGRSLQLDPDFTYTHTLSGYEYMANEDFDKATACFREALRVDDRHYNAWYGLGAIYHRQEKFDLAEYHFERAVSLHPSSSVLRCNLGIAQYANGKAYQALDTLSEASRLDPSNPQARFQRATIFSALHRPEEALRELRKVRDAAPRESTVHFAMGKVLKRLGQPEEAMKCFLTAMDLDPKDNQMIKSALDKLDEPDLDEESMTAY